MSWWLDSEDEDGTRHYSTYNPFTGGGAWPPTKRSLTRQQRRRMIRALGAFWLIFAATSAAGWFVGQHLGQSTLAGVIGMGVALGVLFVLAMTSSVIYGIASGLRKPRR